VKHTLARIQAHKLDKHKKYPGWRRLLIMLIYLNVLIMFGFVYYFVYSEGCRKTK
jgi:hypothetical protein